MAVLVGVTTVAVLAGCGSDDDSGTAATTVKDARTISVKLVDNGCDKPAYTMQAGKVHFVARNTTSNDAEFEILAPGPKIIDEVDPVKAGKTGTLDVTLPADDYELVCALGSDAKRSTLTVTGKGGQATLKVNQIALDNAVAQYRTFVLQESEQLQQGTKAFADAVEAGNIEQAKSLYASGRTPWETIEPVAELFPEVDGAIDSRVDDHKGPDDPEWTGWHRIEKALWADNTTAGMTPFAQKLVTDTDGLVAMVQALQIDPGVMTNGAAGLIEEAAKTKITGEEERYSHTDLVTLAANVAGAKKIIELVGPVLATAPGGQALLDQINAQFTKVDGILAPYQQGGTYVSYEQVNDTTRDQLKAALADLSEELAEVSGTMGLKVK